MRHCLPLALLLLAPAVIWASEVPQTVIWNGQHMRQVKSSAGKADSPYAAPLAALAIEAKKARSRGPYTVTDKTATPPSGDKRDYMSFGTYWWPNPDTEDGLPYIRRDGVANPTANTSDDQNLTAMADDVITLSLAAYFFDDKQSAAHAAKLLRTWFLDEKTRMNPHLEYAQAIPGINQGRGVGIIDTKELVMLLDAVELLRVHGGLSQQDHDGLKQWFGDYLRWLRTSSHGHDEAEADNNHGSWYDAQCARYAIFVGNEKLAKEIVAGALSKRIQSQIEPDGRQPHELARTRSLTYSLFNLQALTLLARIGERYDLDLWEKNKPNSHIRAAFKFVLPYLVDEKLWPYEQIGPVVQESRTIMLLLVLGAHYPDKHYAPVIDHFRTKFPGNSQFLLFP